MDKVDGKYLKSLRVSSAEICVLQQNSTRTPEQDDKLKELVDEITQTIYLHLLSVCRALESKDNDNKSLLNSHAIIRACMKAYPSMWKKIKAMFHAMVESRNVKDMDDCKTYISAIQLVIDMAFVQCSSPEVKMREEKFQATLDALDAKLAALSNVAPSNLDQKLLAVANKYALRLDHFAQLLSKQILLDHRTGGSMGIPELCEKLKADIASVANSQPRKVKVLQIIKHYNLVKDVLIEKAMFIYTDLM